MIRTLIPHTLPIRSNRPLAWALLALAAVFAPARGGVVGPMIGHTTPTSTIVWVRSGQPGEHTLTVAPRRGEAIFEAVRPALASDDLTVRWGVDGLKPDTEYTYSIRLPDGVELTDDDFAFRTPPPIDAPQRVTLAIGARADLEPSPIWTRMLAERADGLVLIGDTPFIDSTELEAQRGAHRALLALPEVSRVIRRTPTWGIWSTHDYGARADGNLPGKYNARVAFTEYRAPASFGKDDEGIYSSFRLGPVEVFLLDTRSFMNIEPSPFAPRLGTLLGAEQWRWLMQALTTSDAPFKVLVSGLVWDTRFDGTEDDWHHFAHERDIMWFQLRQASTPGILALAADMGLSRAMRFPTEEVLGYDFWQFTPGPLGARTEPDLPAFHDAIVHNAAEPGVFLRLTADSTVQPAELTATWINARGDRLFSVTLTAEDLTPKTPPPDFGAPRHQH